MLNLGMVILLTMNKEPERERDREGEREGERERKRERERERERERDSLHFSLLQARPKFSREFYDNDNMLQNC